MQAKSTRIAYLRRMLARLDGEDLRLKDLVAAGELTAEGAELAARQLAKDRDKMLAELRSLEGDDAQSGPKA
jgi:hypothetical protein